MKNFFAYLLKGAACGAASTVPGLSGGSMAVILGVYDEILYKTSNIFKDFKNNSLIFLPFVTGAVLGIYASSIPIGLLCEKYPFVSYSIFFVISFVSVYVFARKTIEKIFTFKNILFIIIGAITAISVSVMIKSDQINANSTVGLLISGFPLAAAIVLPGVSFSYMLLFFGFYEQTINAINTFDLAFIAPLACGTVIGIFSVCRLLSYLLNRYRNTVYCVITGFVFASLYDIILKLYEILTKN